jgi:tetratricopeptide (TPR) repeat protein
MGGEWHDRAKSLGAYRLLAEIYFDSKNFVHVEATREHIIQLAKRLKEIRPLDHIELAEVKLKLEKLEEALHHAKKAVGLEPLNPKFLHFFVKTCIFCKQKNLAWKYYRKLKDVNGENNGLDELLEGLKKL